MPRLAFAPLALLVASLAFAADDEKKTDAADPSVSTTEPRFADTIKPFFAPLTTDRAALAPDGKHVAYTLHKGDTAYVIIMNVDRPDVKLPIALSADRERPKTDTGQINTAGVSAVSDDGESPGFYADEKTPGSVTFLGWANANRLVMASDLPEIFAIDADGQNVKKLVDLDDTNTMNPAEIPANPDTPPKGNSFVRRPPQAIDFIPGDPQHLLIYAEGSGKEGLLVGTFKVDVTTGKLTDINEETYNPGTKVLVDRLGKQRFYTTTFTREQPFYYYARERSWNFSPEFAKGLPPDQAAFWKITPENYHGERAFPIAFGADPNLLYFASNVGRDTFGLYAMDLKTKQRTDFAVEHPHYDLAALDGALTAPQLVFERGTRRLVGIRLNGVRPATRWLDAKLNTAQLELDARFPSRFVQILDWDDAAARFLVQVSSVSDPGRYYIYFRPEKKAMEFLRLAPELDADALSITKPFEFDTPAGVHLTGYLTQPSNTRSDPPPLLIYCHDGPSGRDFPTYNPDAQALAAMGLVVAQVNYRGSDGFGRKNRDAGLAAYERVPVEDALAVADWVSSKQRIDKKRLAIYGIGFGGYIALRALQLAPERFRCAIAIDAPADLNGWINYAQSQIDFTGLSGGPSPDQPGTSGFSTGPSLGSAPRFPPKIDFASELHAVMFGSDRKRLAENSPSRHPELIKRPTLLLQSRDASALPPTLASDLVKKLVKQGLAANYLETNDEFTKRLPQASVAAFAKIEDFINLNIYDYAVKVGPTEVVK